MNGVEFKGSAISFSLVDHASGKKVPAIVIMSGDIQVVVPFDPDAAQQMVQVFVQGIMGTAEAARQANGGLIIPTGPINLDPNKLNGSKG